MKKFRRIKLAAVVLPLGLSAVRLCAQGLLAVDQASGTLDEVVTQATFIPDNQIAQSFTPLLPVVGFVQLQTFIPANSIGETLIINLREDAYNGPIVSSTTPVVLLNKITQISTFYFPESVPVTANQVYYFEPVLLFTGGLDLGTKSPSSYERGDLFSNGIPSGGAGDLWFREGIVVPEAGTVWLLLVGFGGLLCHCRRGRRS
jgi:hypothetical protein